MPSVRLSMMAVRRCWFFSSNLSLLLQASSSILITILLWALPFISLNGIDYLLLVLFEPSLLIQINSCVALARLFFHRQHIPMTSHIAMNTMWQTHYSVEMRWMPTSSTEVVAVAHRHCDWQSWCFYFVVYFKLGNRRLISLAQIQKRAEHKKREGGRHRNEEHSGDYFFTPFASFASFFFENKSKTEKRAKKYATRMIWCMHFCPVQLSLMKLSSTKMLFGWREM